MRSLRTIVPAVLATAALAAVPSAAQADATGTHLINKSPTDNVHITVLGHGTTVEKASATLAAPTFGVGNPKVYLTFFDLDGNIVEQHVTGQHTGTVRSAITLERNYGAKTFPLGRACAAYSENGVMRDGACVNIG